MNQLEADLLILGAGPAGLSAAQIALEHGHSVAMVDQQPAVGGQLWRQGAGHAWPKFRQQRFAAILAHSRMHCLTGHRLALWLSPTHAVVEGPEGSVSVTAKSVLLAAGAREFVPPFPGWTLPGVSGAGALQAMAKTGVRLTGERISLVGSGPLLLASAATLNRSAAKPTGIFEAQSRAQMRGLAMTLLGFPARLAEAAKLRAQCARTRYEYGWKLLAARGESRLESVLLADPAGRTHRVVCTRLGVSYGLVPNVECAAGLNLVQRADGPFACLNVNSEQRTSNPRIYAAGEITGVGGGHLAELEGQIAALAMVGTSQELTTRQRQYRQARRFADRLAAAFAISQQMLPDPDPAIVLCRCEDVAWSAAVNRSNQQWRALKLASRVGMGACQGRTCGAILRAYGCPHPISSRPPVMPVCASTLADLDHLTTHQAQGSSQ